MKQSNGYSLIREYANILYEERVMQSEKQQNEKNWRNGAL